MRIARAMRTNRDPAGGPRTRAHVFQYMVLGPLFLPTYLLCGGISVRNPFERAADRYAADGGRLVAVMGRRRTVCQRRRIFVMHRARFVADRGQWLRRVGVESHSCR
jgi:hypothetical protein